MNPHTEALTLSPTNTAALARFSAVTGIDSTVIITQALRAIGDHVQLHGTLSFPLRIGLPSAACGLCLHSRPPDAPASPTPNILPGPGFRS